MRKKQIVLLVVGIIFVGLISSLGTYYFVSNKSSKETLSKSKQSTSLVKKDDNKINGYDISPLTKEQFKKAIETGKKLKDVKEPILTKYGKERSIEEFKKTKGFGFTIYTPYIKTANIVDEINKKYIEPNEDNIVKEFKKQNINLKEISCSAFVGGDDMDFLENLHMVLKVYSKDGKQVVIQPKELIKNESYEAQTTPFFPDSPVYSNGLIGKFDSEKVISLKPKYLEIVVIYPGGDEVKEKFEYSKLNM